MWPWIFQPLDRKFIEPPTVPSDQLPLQADQFIDIFLPEIIGVADIPHLAHRSLGMVNHDETIRPRYTESVWRDALKIGIRTFACRSEHCPSSFDHTG
ncbi:hypothetical protein ACFY2K_11980 [Kitasatospora sp. NPDC001309]|uniref:hypothetical protein n=1 Tax=Kitasatospora sp. NPDC001309 TaxID=3364013 RepID=UPI003691A87A